MRRSVTAELELEAGEYHVLVKVEARKDFGRLPVEQVVRNSKLQPSQAQRLSNRDHNYFQMPKLVRKN